MDAPWDWYKLKLATALDSCKAECLGKAELETRVTNIKTTIVLRLNASLSDCVIGVELVYR